MNKKKANTPPKVQTKISSFFIKPGFGKSSLIKKKSTDQENVDLNNTVLNLQEDPVIIIEDDAPRQFPYESYSMDSNIDIIESVQPVSIAKKDEKNKICKKKYHLLDDDIKESPSKKIRTNPNKSKIRVLTVDKLNQLTNQDITLFNECHESDKLSRIDSGFIEPKNLLTPLDDYPIVDLFDSDPFDVDFEDLDLTEWQKCKIMSLENTDVEINLKLKNIDGKLGSCSLKESWTNVILDVGSMISLIAVKNESNKYFISDKEGYCILWPDDLITGTDIVGSLFCMRKSVLQNNFRGLDSGNKHMVIGTFVHELFQKSLQKKFSTLQEITQYCEYMLKKPEMLYNLYEADMDVDIAIIEMQKYVPQIHSFITKFMYNSVSTEVSSKTVNQSKYDKIKWNGCIDNVVDIEENIWSPNLGISGRIDVSVEVNINNAKFKKKKLLMPLELKTGRPSNSSEHRGQVILYTMLMSEIEKKKESPGDLVTEGLLLYLKDGVEIHQISSNHNEKRDLIILRNRLAYYMEKWKLSSGHILPPPINHHSACSKCPYLTICSLHLNNDQYKEVSDGNPLIKLKDEAIGHLQSTDINYFLHWCHLTIIEESEQKASIQKKSDIWTIPVSDREIRGKCLGEMKIKELCVRDDRYEHIFYKSENARLKSFNHSQLQVGDYVIISSENKLAEDTGFIMKIDEKTISIELSKNLGVKRSQSILYCIDSYETTVSTIFNLTNLGMLMDNTETSNKLRKIIINKEFSPPKNKNFNNKKNIDSILKGLNVVQAKAVLKVLSAPDFILIKGMPGTGKTQTLVALVESFVKLNKSVLITSQTHSAIDNIFLRLKTKNIKMLRLGSNHRIHNDLHDFTETNLTKCCNTPNELDDTIKNINVVGVTCLGSNHILLRKRTFDVCIVDESTQVLQSTILRPLFFANSFVLVGDPHQLPPIVKNSQARDLGMDESLFLRLDNLGATVSLTLQYRMNETIMKLANRLTYNGELQCANEEIAKAVLKFNTQILQKKPYTKKEHKWIKKCLSTSIENAITVIDTGNTYSRCIEQKQNLCTENITQLHCTNICEAFIIFYIVNILLNGGVNSGTIGVVAPYRDQVIMLKNIAQTSEKYVNLEINTVDQYQGRDKDVVIYSCTKSLKNGDNEKDTMENQILNDKRRLTVAITRAKHKLILVGDVASLSLYRPFKEMFSFFETDNFGCYINIPELSDAGHFNWDNVFMH